MSHYSVAIITKNIKDIDKLLAPYDENLELAFEEDEEGNLVGYNPNAKWDWYQVGGRFAYSLPLKTGQYANSCTIGELNLDPNPEEYQEAIEFWEAVVEGKETEEPPFTLYKPEYYIDMYGTKEAFAARRSKFYTYALISPIGEWLEPGRMGWWAMTTETPESKLEYEDAFEKILSSTPEDYHITIVDCHI